MAITDSSQVMIDWQGKARQVFIQWDFSSQQKLEWKWVINHIIRWNGQYIYKWTEFLRQQINQASLSTLLTETDYSLHKFYFNWALAAYFKMEFQIIASRWHLWFTSMRTSWSNHSSLITTERAFFRWLWWYSSSYWFYFLHIVIELLLTLLVWNSCENVGVSLRTI